MGSICVCKLQNLYKTLNNRLQHQENFKNIEKNVQYLFSPECTKTSFFKLEFDFHCQFLLMLYNLFNDKYVVGHNIQIYIVKVMKNVLLPEFILQSAICKTQI